MADSNRYPSPAYAPSAPPLPAEPPSSSSSSSLYHSGYAPSPPPWGGGGGSGAGASCALPPGTHPDVIRSFRAADRDGSGSIDERELQAALSVGGGHEFSIRTVRLLMFLFNKSGAPSNIGPAEFTDLWNCLGQWRAIFDRFDQDRSGKINSDELREALRSLGYAVPPSVIQLLISNYADGTSRRGALDFDNFVECGMVVKGLTDKFKEKDLGYTGSATMTHDAFMSMVIPFIVP